MPYGICRADGYCSCGLCANIKYGRATTKVRENTRPRRVGVSLPPKPRTTTLVEDIEEARGPFIWTLYYEAPDTRNWRISGLDLYGRERLEVEVEIDCSPYRRSVKMSTCSICGEKHEIPKETDKKYAFNYYPMKPSLRAVVQWHRRRVERLYAH